MTDEKRPELPGMGELPRKKARAQRLTPATSSRDRMLANVMWARLSTATRVACQNILTHAKAHACKGELQLSDEGVVIFGLGNDSRVFRAVKGGAQNPALLPGAYFETLAELAAAGGMVLRPSGAEEDPYALAYVWTVPRAR